MKNNIKESLSKIDIPAGRKDAMLDNILSAANRIRRGNEKENRIMKNIWKFALAAAGVAALAIVLPTALRGSGEYSAMNSQSAPTETVQVIPTAETKDYVTAILLSMNPDVEIRLDADGVVTEVIGLNEDGVALIAGIDFAGMSLENATIMVVNQLILQGYITANEIHKEINISLSSDTMTLDTLSVMTNIIETAAEKHNIAVDVVQDAEANKLQIKLQTAGDPDTCPELKPVEGSKDKSVGVEVEFVMTDYTYSACVDNIVFHTREGKTIQYMLDYAGYGRLNRAAINAILELIEKGYISDADGSTARFYFSGKCGDSDIIRLAELTKLLIAEYGLKIAVTADLEKNEIRLAADETVIHEEQISKYTLKEVLNVKINKDEEELSPRQIEILKSAFTYREYQRLLEKRYYVIIPNLIGMTEEQAHDTLQQLGIGHAFLRVKLPGYDPEKENGGLNTSDIEDSLAREGRERGHSWDYPVVDFGCVFYQDEPAGRPCPIDRNFQINVIVPMDDERPENADYRKNRSYTIMDMDVPFDVSAYPDTFSLSDAAGFDPMIFKVMNDCHPITNKADYTVTIDRDTGWEDTAVITIKHKDGYPMALFFVQYGRIIEFEWRDAPLDE